MFDEVVDEGWVDEFSFVGNEDMYGLGFLGEGGEWVVVIEEGGVEVGEVG